MMDDAVQLDLGSLIETVSEGSDLSADQAEGAFNTIMSGEASPVAMAALLIGLRTKGVVPAEIAGGVRALRRAMVPVASERTHELVDTCGTGGGVVTTFNVSTAAALVAAGAGVRIAKHGNRSFTSRSGSADALEALGVRIEMSPEEMSRVLHEAGIVFMFAPLLHPAMRHIGPVRRELGVPTIMNLLGPLTNPARVGRQVVGVSDPSWVSLVVHALRELGHERGPRRAWRARDGRAQPFRSESGSRARPWRDRRVGDLSSRGGSRAGRRCLARGRDSARQR